MNNLFYSLITLAVALVFLLTGIIGVLIPWSPEVRDGLIRFISEDYVTLSLFGLLLLVVAAAIIANIFVGMRRRYYHLSSGARSVAIDESAIQQLLNAYWQQNFYDKDIPSRLILKNNRIHISAELPQTPENEQKALLEKIKEDLQETFADTLGYHSEFFLSISFRPNTQLPIKP
jgi:hypothetical protein